MDYQSLKKFEGKRVKLILNNNYWYRALITLVTETTCEFTEEKGKKLGVAPSFVAFVEEL